MKKVIFLPIMVMFSTITFAQELWVSTSYNNVPSPRSYHTAVWSGDKMIVWGGQYDFDDIRTGGIYDPISNSWSPTDTLNAPSKRELHTAVWTGSKMIVWGGFYSDSNGSYLLNSGGIYDPLTNNWNSVSTVNAPSGRFHHTAIWTGTHMIIWGGQCDTSGSTNTGGIYDPITDLWANTSINNAPSPRHYHTAVWTGSKMIIWGGLGGGANILNSGGIYDPINDNWVSTTLSNSPLPRFLFAGIWTGTKMIVWGGAGNSGPMNSGGIYSNPTVIGIGINDPILPNRFKLHQNYPNPFNPNTTINFDIPKNSNIVLKVYDISGKVVAILSENEFKIAGSYKVTWNAENFSSGVYFCRIEADNFVDIKKMVLIK